MQLTPTSRCASALLMAVCTLVVCAGLAMAMIGRTTAAVTLQTARERGDRAHFTAASAANWASQWCLSNAALMPAFTGVNQDLVVPTALTTAFQTSSNRPNQTTPTFKLTGLRVNADLSRLYNLSCSVTSGTAGSLGYTTSTQDFLLKYTPPVTTPSSTTTTGLFTRAMFGKLGFSVQGSPNVDAWNGANGAYIAPKGNTPGNAISNYGSALVGSNGTVTPQGNGWHINSNPQIQNNAGVTEPDYTWSAPTSYTNQPSSGNTNSAWSGNITLQAGQTYYAPGGIGNATITVNVPNTITQQADAVCTIYIGGEFLASNPFQFTGTNANWGRIVMYQKDITDTITDTSWNGNSTAGVVSDPSRFIFITEYGKGKAGNITMNGTGAFGGIIYAPYASVHLNGTFDFYGSLNVGTVSEFNGNFGLHFDSRLAGVSLTLPNGAATTTPASVTLLGWRER